MPTKIKAVVCDLDGTVARRVPELRESPYDMTKVSLDEPIWPVIDLANTLCEVHGAALIVVTARENTGACFEDSLRWLQKYGLNPVQVFMRRAKDFRPDAEVKEEFYRNNIEPVYEVLYVLDDRDPVVAKWRELGLTCLQVADGAF